MSDISTREIADKLVGYCRSNDTQTGLNELYDPNAVSVSSSQCSPERAQICALGTS